MGYTEIKQLTHKEKLMAMEAIWDDLSRAYHFYDMQELGVGAYFFDSVTASPPPHDHPLRLV
jgi:hypothetical protein